MFGYLLILIIQHNVCVRVEARHLKWCRSKSVGLANSGKTQFEPLRLLTPKLSSRFLRRLPTYNFIPNPRLLVRRQKCSPNLVALQTDPEG
jgi:hypothetical protein